MDRNKVKRLRFAAALTGVVLVACACGGASLAPIESAPQVPERPDGTVAKADREVQEQARLVHKICSEQREQLQDDVESAEAGDIGLISAATVAMVLGEAADGRSVEQLQRPTTDRIEAVPREQPSQRLESETRAAAEARVREINLELDRAQSFLNAHPDPTVWSEVDSLAWNEQLERLRVLCR